MQAYEKGLMGNSRMILSPDSEFFRYFSNPAGNTTPRPPRAGPEPRAARP
jgi:membrane protease subunit HflC